MCHFHHVRIQRDVCHPQKVTPLTTLTLLSWTSSSHNCEKQFSVVYDPFNMLYFAMEWTKTDGKNLQTLK